ncbi:hypothetical protein EI94DRAFT_1328320 [Lactarius quietus]|nr:hypothetical protein EI94DRAFT_1328320 [Lactarius quietus]
MKYCIPVAVSQCSLSKRVCGLFPSCHSNASRVLSYLDLIAGRHETFNLNPLAHSRLSSSNPAFVRLHFDQPVHRSLFPILPSSHFRSPAVDTVFNYAIAASTLHILLLLLQCLLESLGYYCPLPILREFRTFGSVGKLLDAHAEQEHFSELNNQLQYVCRKEVHSLDRLRHLLTLGFLCLPAIFLSMTPISFPRSSVAYAATFPPSPASSLRHEHQHTIFLVVEAQRFGPPITHLVLITCQEPLCQRSLGPQGIKARHDDTHQNIQDLQAAK